MSNNRRQRSYSIQQSQGGTGRSLRIECLEARLVLATTVSVADGGWHDGATWDNGVPDESLRAIVSSGTTVDLAGVTHIAKELVIHGQLTVDEGAATGPSDPTTLGPDRLRLSYDGILVGTEQGTQLDDHATGAIGLGGPNGSLLTHNGPITSGFFDGQLDSVLNYNRVLTDADIALLAAELRSDGSTLPVEDAVAEWNFDSPLELGDYDRDGIVGGGDLSTWSGSYGSTVFHPGHGADGIGDGLINGADFLAWQTNHGATSSPAQPLDVAPNDSINDDGTLVTGQELMGGALLLEGEGEMMQVNSSTEINQGTFVDKSISLWFNADDTSGFQVLYEQGDAARGLSIYLSGDTLYAGAWNTLATGEDWPGDWIVQTGVTAGQWHHVALTLDADLVTTSADKSLTTRWVHVNSGGLFQVGSLVDRYDSGNCTLTLTGTDVTADHVVETTSGTTGVTDNDGFLMATMGGQLQFFGEEKLSFTKLATTADVGLSTITVENIIERNFTAGAVNAQSQFITSAVDDGTLNWEVGDKIVIAGNNHHRQEEVRTITAVNDTGTETILTLDSPLENRHFGEIETYGNGTRTWDIDMRAEVALLSRNVKIKGTNAQDTDIDFDDRARYLTTNPDGSTVAGAGAAHDDHGQRGPNDHRRSAVRSDGPDWRAWPISCALARGWRPHGGRFRETPRSPIRTTVA